MPIDYSKCRVYKLVCDGSEDFYVGSTCNKLSKRLADHRFATRQPRYQQRNVYKWMNEMGADNIQIILVSEHPDCASFEQQRMFEREVVDRLKPSLNSIRPYQTQDERRQQCRKYDSAHREERREYDRRYNEAHREERREYDRRYNEAHREEISEKRRRHREAHSEECREKDRAYYEAHHEECLEKARRFREANRDKINERQRQAYAAKKASNNPAATQHSF